MNMIHRGCGGIVSEDPTSPPYHYDSNKDTCNPEDPEIPVFRCKKCGHEIYSDAMIVFDPPIE